MWNPDWLVIWDQASSYGLLAVILAVTLKHRSYVANFGILGFLVALKVSLRAQFWYLMLLPSFLTDVPTWVYPLLILCEPMSLVSILFGPFGYMVPHYYDGLTVFTRLHL